jgi:hypothetical protein
MFKWIQLTTRLPHRGQDVDWVNREGEEVIGGRYWNRHFWEEPPSYVPTRDQVTAWRPSTRDRHPPLDLVRC